MATNAIIINGITYKLKSVKMSDYGDGYACRDCALEKICSDTCNACGLFGQAAVDKIFVATEDVGEIVKDEAFTSKGIRKALRKLVNSATKSYEDALRLNELIKQIKIDE